MSRLNLALPRAFVATPRRVVLLAALSIPIIILLLSATGQQKAVSSRLAHFSPPFFSNFSSDAYALDPAHVEAYKHKAQQQQCQSILQNGRFLDSTNNPAPYKWQPTGCTINDFTTNPALLGMCLKPGDQIIFWGDSTGRQIYWALANMLDSSNRQDHGVHSNHQIVWNGIYLKLLWDPFLNGTTNYAVVKEMAEQGHRSTHYKEPHGRNLDPYYTPKTYLYVTTGLWHAMFSSNETLISGFETSIQNFLHIVDNRVDHSFDRVYLGPTMMSNFAFLDSSRKNKITQEVIGEMNAYTENLFGYKRDKHGQPLRDSLGVRFRNNTKAQRPKPQSALSSVLESEASSAPREDLIYKTSFNLTHHGRNYSLEEASVIDGRHEFYQDPFDDISVFYAPVMNEIGGSWTIGNYDNIGLHYINSATFLQANLLLNHICNARITDPTLTPHTVTCCVPYGGENHNPQLNMFLREYSNHNRSHTSIPKASNILPRTPKDIFSEYFKKVVLTFFLGAVWIFYIRGSALSRLVDLLDSKQPFAWQDVAGPATVATLFAGLITIVLLLVSSYAEYCDRSQHTTKTAVYFTSFGLFGILFAWATVALLSIGPGIIGGHIITPISKLPSAKSSPSDSKDEVEMSSISLSSLKAQHSPYRAVSRLSLPLIREGQGLFASLFLVLKMAGVDTVTSHYEGAIVLRVLATAWVGLQVYEFCHHQFAFLFVLKRSNSQATSTVGMLTSRYFVAKELRVVLLPLILSATLSYSGIQYQFYTFGTRLFFWYLYAFITVSLLVLTGIELDRIFRLPSIAARTKYVSLAVRFVVIMLISRWILVGKASNAASDTAPPILILQDFWIMNFVIAGAVFVHNYTFDVVSTTGSSTNYDIEDLEREAAEGYSSSSSTSSGLYSVSSNAEFFQNQRPTDTTLASFWSAPSLKCSVYVLLITGLLSTFVLFSGTFSGSKGLPFARTVLTNSLMSPLQYNYQKHFGKSSTSFIDSWGNIVLPTNGTLKDLLLAKAESDSFKSTVEMQHIVSTSAKEYGCGWNTIVVISVLVGWIILRQSLLEVTKSFRHNMNSASVNSNFYYYYVRFFVLIAPYTYELLTLYPHIYMAGDGTTRLHLLESFFSTGYITSDIMLKSLGYIGGAVGTPIKYGFSRFGGGPNYPTSNVFTYDVETTIADDLGPAAFHLGVRPELLDIEYTGELKLSELQVKTDLQHLNALTIASADSLASQELLDKSARSMFIKGATTFPDFSETAVVFSRSSSNYFYISYYTYMAIRERIRYSANFVVVVLVFLTVSKWAALVWKPVFSQEFGDQVLGFESSGFEVNMFPLIFGSKLSSVWKRIWKQPMKQINGSILNAVSGLDPSLNSSFPSSTLSPSSNNKNDNNNNNNNNNNTNEWDLSGNGFLTDEQYDDEKHKNWHSGIRNAGQEV